MYADNTVIYVSAKTPNGAAETLTDEIQNVSQWLKSKVSNLTLNIKKTVSMCFSLKRKVNDSFIVKLDEDEIKEVSDFKFLGVILDAQLKFDKRV